MKEDSEWKREFIPGFLQNTQSHIRTYCRPWIFNIDTKNGGLEKLTPLKSGSFFPGIHVSMSNVQFFCFFPVYRS